MNPELAALAILAAPGAILGTVCIAGHLLTRRHDAAIAAAFHTAPVTAPQEPPTGGGEPAPDALANVIAFPTHRTEQRDHAHSA